MATRGMFSTTDLRPPLAERGIDLSPARRTAWSSSGPERLSLKTLMALLDILGCTMNELIEPVAVPRAGRRKAAAGGTIEQPGQGPPV